MKVLWCQRTSRMWLLRALLTTKARVLAGVETMLMWEGMALGVKKKAALVD